MPFHAGSCDGYTNITDAWRNLRLYSSSFAGYPNDDAHLVGSWWRFTGIGGDRIVSGCYGGPRGGTKYVISFLSTQYPLIESATPTTAYAYGSTTYCSLYAITMNVVLCPGGFYIYKPTNHPYKPMGYVTCKELLLIIILSFIFYSVVMSLFNTNAMCVFVSVYILFLFRPL